MDPARFARLQELFDRALEFEGPARDEFLRGVEGEDRELGERLRDLLSNYTEDPDYLEDSHRHLDRALDELNDLEGQTLGPYRILRRLGQGGMGVVHLAERADGAYEQRVAIKLVRRGMDTEQIVRRFQAERRILASLQHPHIARVFDAGVAPDGRPFLVMEAVEGQRIDEACDERGWGVDARVALLAKVAHAVHAAHQKLVVHRDLKPGNIFVDAAGEPKLLDFGIAKILDPDDTAEMTRTQFRPHTPRYASPEQQRGEAVSTSTDVYSLGVLLRELLEATGDAWTRNDLAKIVAMASHEEAERRYASAEALAEDLERCRQGRPVVAHEDSFGYRMGRWVGRNRAAATGIAAFVVLLVAFAGVTAWQSARIARERDRAQLESENSAQVVDLFVDVFSYANPELNPDSGDFGGSDFFLRAADRVRALDSQPDVQGRAWLAIASIHNSHGRHDEAQEILEEALLRRSEIEDEQLVFRLRHEYAKALLPTNLHAGRALLEELESEIRRDHGEIHPDRAVVLTELSWHERDLEARRARLEEAQRVQEALPVPNPISFAGTLNALGAHRIEVRDPAGAVEYFQRALEILDSQVGPVHPHRMTLSSNLAGAYTRLGRLDEAEAMCERAIEAGKQLYGEESVRLASAYEGLAVTRSHRGRHAEAEPAFRRTVELFEEVHGRVHARVYNARRNVARSLMLQGRDSEALEWMRGVYEICRELRGDDFFGTHYFAAYCEWLEARALGRASSDFGRSLQAMESMAAAPDSMYLSELRLAWAMESGVKPSLGLPRARLAQEWRSRRLPENHVRRAEADALVLWLESESRGGLDDASRAEFRRAVERYEAWGLADPHWRRLLRAALDSEVDRGRR